MRGALYSTSLDVPTVVGIFTKHLQHSGLGCQMELSSGNTSAQLRAVQRGPWYWTVLHALPQRLSVQVTRQHAHTLVHVDDRFFNWYRAIVAVALVLAAVTLRVSVAALNHIDIITITYPSTLILFPVAAVLLYIAAHLVLAEKAMKSVIDAVGRDCRQHNRPLDRLSASSTGAARRGVLFLCYLVAALLVAIWDVFTSWSFVGFVAFLLIFSSLASFLILTRGASVRATVLPPTMFAGLAFVSFNLGVLPYFYMGAITTDSWEKFQRLHIIAAPYPYATEEQYQEAVHWISIFRPALLVAPIVTACAWLVALFFITLSIGSCNQVRRELLATRDMRTSLAEHVGSGHGFLQ